MGINRYYKYIIYILTAIIICGCLSPVYADSLTQIDDYIPDGISWVDYSYEAVNLSNSTSRYLYVDQIRTSRCNFDDYTGQRDLYRMTFYLYDPIINTDQPVAIFVFRRIQFYSNTVFRIPYSADIPIYNYDSISVHDNDTIYFQNIRRPNGGIGYCVIYLPIKYLGTYALGLNGISAENYCFTFAGPDNATRGCRQEPYSGFSYVGNIDFNIGNIENYLSSIDTNIYDIDDKIDAIYNILQNQQASSDATQAENQTTLLHNDIDLIQNNNMTDINTNITYIMNNPDYNMSNPSIISGATYITAIANNIFTNAGVFSWAFVFPAFIALTAYVMGRVGLIH